MNSSHHSSRCESKRGETILHIPKRRAQWMEGSISGSGRRRAGTCEALKEELGRWRFVLRGVGRGEKGRTRREMDSQTARVAMTLPLLETSSVRWKHAFRTMPQRHAQFKPANHKDHCQMKSWPKSRGGKEVESRRSWLHDREVVYAVSL